MRKQSRGRERTRGRAMQTKAGFSLPFARKVSRPEPAQAPARRGGQGPGHERGALGRFFSRRVVMITSACLAVAILAVTVGAVAANAATPVPVAGYEAFLDGRSLGFVEDPQAVRDQMAAVIDGLSAQYDTTAVSEQELTFTEIFAYEESFASPENIRALLDSQVEVDVMAAVIKVNNRPAAALRTREEAEGLLNAICEEYRTEEGGGVGFIERVDIYFEPVAYDLLYDYDTALTALTKGLGHEDIWYEVQKGDSLSRIASAHNMTLSEIVANNPEIGEDSVIQPGQRINLAIPSRWVNVRYTYDVTEEKSMPYETVTEESDELYTDQKEVVSAGETGLSRVTTRKVYVNGRFAEESVIAEDVITPSVAEVVKQGTKVRPVAPSVNTAGTWGIPLKAGVYRISSKFGTRTLNGTTRMHKGVDMAAPSGTPIYAAMDGTVQFAGTASGYGLVIYLNSSGGIQTRYGHCSKLLVKAGDKVKKGDKIALVGNTGVSTGPHLHFEVRVNGNPVNPIK